MIKKLIMSMVFIGLWSIFLANSPRANASPTDSGIITGRVLSSADGQAISSAVVRVDEVVMPTDTNGNFAFSAVDSGVYTIYYDASGYEPQKQENITVFPGVTTATPTVILTSHSGEIYGKVISLATNQFVPGTAVRINNIVVPTNPNGEFRFTLVNPGVYNIYYDALGHLPQVQENIAVPSNQVTTPPMVVLSTDGPPHIKIDISENQLHLHYGSFLVKSYPIATGMRRYPTPIGTYKIIRKDINPTWYPPKWADVKEPVRPGPKNPLGTRRLLLSDPSYGIHGTNQLWSIGKRVTHGCIRLYPWEIVDLYDRVTVGTVVEIVP